MAEILITDPNGESLNVRLEESRRYTVGRAKDCDVVIPDLALSRVHAEIYREGGRWMIRDCGSSNGTFLRNQRLELAEQIPSGTPIKMGASTLELQTDNDPGVDERLDTSVFTLTLPVTDISVDFDESPTSSTKIPTAEAAFLRRRIAIMEKANLELLGHEPMDLLLPKILDLVCSAVQPERAAILGLRDDGMLECRVSRGVNPEELSLSKTIVNAVIRESTAVLTSDAQADSRFAEAVSILDLGIRAVMAAPLWDRKKVIGLIYADSRVQSKIFTEQDLTILTILANIAAIQIERTILVAETIEKNRLQSEVNAAARIQRGLLPVAPPVIPDYEFIGHNSPCHEVGGDYYDCLALQGERRGIVIGDVAGKGMGAALVMAVLQATFHARVETESDPRRLIGHINRTIGRSVPSNRFVTLFYMELDPISHRVRCVNAGHAPPPLIVRRSGEIVEIPVGGAPLGVLEQDYPVTEVELNPGDVIFSCSDGVTDMTAPDGEMFGYDRLREVLSSVAGSPLDRIWDAVDSRLKAHARGALQPDDLTVVAIRRRHHPSPARAETLVE